MYGQQAASPPVPPARNFARDCVIISDAGSQTPTCEAGIARAFHIVCAVNGDRDISDPGCLESRMLAKDDPHRQDIRRVSSIHEVPLILEACRAATGMGFTAIARVTEDRWITCASLDHVGFGLLPGDELDVAPPSARTCGLAATRSSSRTWMRATSTAPTTRHAATGSRATSRCQSSAAMAASGARSAPSTRSRGSLVLRCPPPSGSSRSCSYDRLASSDPRRSAAARSAPVEPARQRGGPRRGERADPG